MKKIPENLDDEKMDFEVTNRQLEPEKLEKPRINSSVYVANDVKWAVELEEPKMSGQNPAKIELESDAEKLQNEIRMARDKEADEWNRASAKAMMANHKNKDRLIIFEHKLRKINQLLSFNYYETSTVNRKVSSTDSLQRGNRASLSKLYHGADHCVHLLKRINYYHTAKSS